MSPNRCRSCPGALVSATHVLRPPRRWMPATMRASTVEPEQRSGNRSSSTEIGRPQTFEPSDGRVRKRTLFDCGERLPEVVERADPDDPGRDVALAEHEAKRRLRPRAVAVAQRSVDRVGTA